MIDDQVKMLAQQAAELGIAENSYIVGGAIRDHLLGRPAKNLNVLVEGEPLEFARKVAEALQCAILTAPDGSLHIGTTEIRISRTRKRGGASGSLAEDLERRDFCCNSLLWRLSDALKASSVGDLPILDSSGGLKDVLKRVLRTPGASLSTFEEDPSRILRAAYFCAAYQMTLDPRAELAIKAAVPRIRTVSSEALFDVLFGRILASEDLEAIRALELLKDWGALAVLLKTIHPSRIRRGLATRPRPHRVLLKLARLGFEIGVKFGPGHLDQLEAVQFEPQFPDLFERYLRPFDIEELATRTGLTFAEMEGYVLKARDLVLQGLSSDVICCNILEACHTHATHENNVKAHQNLTEALPVLLEELQRLHQMADRLKTQVEDSYRFFLTQPQKGELRRPAASALTMLTNLRPLVDQLSRIERNDLKNLTSGGGL